MLQVEMFKKNRTNTDNDENKRTMLPKSRCWQKSGTEHILQLFEKNMHPSFAHSVTTCRCCKCPLQLEIWQTGFRQGRVKITEPVLTPQCTNQVLVPILPGNWTEEYSSFL